MVDVVSFSCIAGRDFGCSCNPDGQHGGMFLCLKPLFGYTHLILLMPFQGLEKEDAICCSSLGCAIDGRKGHPFLDFYILKGRELLPTLPPLNFYLLTNALMRVNQ